MFWFFFCLNEAFQVNIFFQVIAYVYFVRSIDLHMLWMVTYTVNELIWLKFADANVVDSCEQWEPVRKNNQTKEIF